MVHWHRSATKVAIARPKLRMKNETSDHRMTLRRSWRRHRKKTIEALTKARIGLYKSWFAKSYFAASTLSSIENSGMSCPW
jgi:hypothetical protein